MEIFAKSALYDDNLKDKVNRGASNIEVQLLDELLHMSAKELFDRTSSLIKKYPISAVHAPLLKDYEMTTENLEEAPFMRETCRFAQLVAEAKGKNIIVIIHVSASPETLKDFGVYDLLINNLKQWLDENDKIIIGLENVTDCDFNEDKGKLYLVDASYMKDNHFYSASIEIAKAISHPRLGCVIDYCHSLMTSNLFKNLLDFLHYNKEVPDFTDEIFMKAAPYTVLYHLANYKYAGYNLGTEQNHGTAFHTDSDSDIILLERFFELYDQACTSGNKGPDNIPITLEVYENDYTKCENFSTTLEAVRSLGR